MGCDMGEMGGWAEKKSCLERIWLGAEWWEPRERVLTASLLEPFTPGLWLSKRRFWRERRLAEERAPRIVRRVESRAEVEPECAEAIAHRLLVEEREPSPPVVERSPPCGEPIVGALVCGARALELARGRREPPGKKE